MCKVIDLLLMIVYSNEKEESEKKRLENLERKKNKTQVVLSSPALQVSHWNVSRSDDVVTFPPVMTSQY